MVVFLDSTHITEAFCLAGRYLNIPDRARRRKRSSGGDQWDLPWQTKIRLGIRDIDSGDGSIFALAAPIRDQETFFDLRRINIETILKTRGGAAW